MNCGLFGEDGDGTFGCENFKLKHDRPALALASGAPCLGMGKKRELELAACLLLLVEVSMAHKRGEEGKQSSQFFFTSKAPSPCSLVKQQPRSPKGRA